MTVLYSLFKKEDRRWVRVADAAYPRATAVRVFQDRLLAGHGSLRPIKGGTASPTPADHLLCAACVAHLHADCTLIGCNCFCKNFK